MNTENALCIIQAVKWGQPWVVLDGWITYITIGMAEEAYRVLTQPKEALNGRTSCRVD